MAYADKEKAKEYSRNYLQIHRQRYKSAHRERNRKLISDYIAVSTCSVCGGSKNLELLAGSFAGDDASQIGVSRLKGYLDKATIVCRGCKKSAALSSFNSYRKNRKIHNKRLVEEYLSSHSCVDCKESDWRVLEFDHREGETKKATLAHLTSQAYSMTALMSEIAKCDVRCVCCHRIRHIRRNARMVEYLEGRSCIDCGTTRIEILDFDHREPVDKQHKIGRMIRKGRALEDIQTEIDKCDVRCAKCHRLRHLADKSVFYRNRQNDRPNELREQALQRFRAQPDKCFQRHIREVIAEANLRPVLQSLVGAVVEKISQRDAKDLITQYEWLGTMAAGIILSYGLRINGELIGAVCFNRGAFDRVRHICGKEYAGKVAFLCRGACVPWAPKNAASYLIRHSTEQALQHGYSIFVAYSDATAGEIGTVYQAVGWKYIGYGNRNARRSHTDMISPDDEHWSSYEVWTNRENLRSEYSIPITVGLIQGLEQQGWQRIKLPEKARYVWFEGPDKNELMKACRYPFLPYPKRNNGIGQRSSTPIIEDSRDSRAETGSLNLGTA